MRTSRTLLLAAAVGAGGLWLLDRFDIPSRLVESVPRAIERARLTLRPIVVTDSGFFERLGAGPDPALGAVARERSWAAYRAYRARHAPVRFFPPAKVRAIVGRLELAGEAQRVLTLADAYREDRFQVMGYDSVLTLGRDFHWTSFPPRYDALGIWEVATLQHLPLLAQAYLLTGNPAYAHTVARHLRWFLDDNPIGNGVNWIAAMEVSLRLVSLLMVEDLLLEADAFRDAYPELVKSLYAHARFVADHIDRPLRPNAHDIFAAMGLYAFARRFPELAESAAWARRGQQRVLEQLDRQYTADGAHRELAAMYHKALLDAYLHFVATERAAGEVVDERLRRRLSLQLDFLEDLVGPDGRFALIGDSDDHFFHRLGPAAYDDARPTLLAGAVLLGRRYPPHVVPGGAWEAAWLTEPVGALAALRPKRTRAAPQARLRTYEEAGYFRVDDGRFSLVGNFRPPGVDAAFAGHHHADVSSFVLWTSGAPLVVDAGTLTYRRGLRRNGVRWRDWLRSSFAHNVTTVDGRDQAEPLTGDFGFATPPSGRLITARTAGDVTVIVGTHQAYDSLVGWAWRVFVIGRDAVAVVDWFPLAAGRHVYESRLLFAGEVAEAEAGAFHVGPSRGRLVTEALGGDARRELLRGSLRPPGGWRSTAYGGLTPTPQVRLTATIEGPAVLAALLELAPAGHTEPTDALEVHRLGPDVAAVILAVNGARTALLLNAAWARRERLARWSTGYTDALVAVVALRPEPHNLLVVGGRQVEWAATEAPPTAPGPRSSARPRIALHRSPP